MDSFKELNVWKKSIDLVVLIYAITSTFPEEEKYGLTSQVRRAAVSIASNIAEGHERKSDADFMRFLRIAYGSSAEIETQLLIAERLTFISKEDFNKVSDELIAIRKMLNKFMSTIAKS